MRTGATITTTTTAPMTGGRCIGRAEAAFGVPGNAKAETTGQDPHRDVAVDPPATLLYCKARIPYTEAAVPSAPLQFLNLESQEPHRDRTKTLLRGHPE